MTIKAQPDVKELFVPINKMFDGPDGFFVEGVLAIEEPDREREIWDYASSKKSVVDWAEDARKRTQGKSVGNLRAMHGKIAVGRFLEVNPDDAAKRVYVKAEIVDEQDKEKARKGVYSGFSIRAPYARKWSDPASNGRYTRWTSGPIIEGSLADIPCMYSATFAYKSLGVDGSVLVEEDRRFSQYEDLDALANRVAEKLGRGKSDQNNKEEEMVDLKSIAEKNGLDPAKAVTFIDEALKAMKEEGAGGASKCMKSASDCTDADCADHKAAKAVAAQKVADQKEADEIAAKAARGEALKASDIRTIFREELAKSLDTAIAEKVAPMESVLDKLAEVVGRIAASPIPSAVSRGEFTATKSGDGATDAEKAVGKLREDASKLAKDGKVEDAIKSIHQSGPVAIMTNRGMQRA